MTEQQILVKIILVLLVPEGGRPLQAEVSSEPISHRVKVYDLSQKAALLFQRLTRPNPTVTIRDADQVHSLMDEAKAIGKLGLGPHRATFQTAYNMIDACIDICSQNGFAY